MKCFNNSHVLGLRGIAGFLAFFTLAITSEATLYTTTGNSSSSAVPSWTDSIWQPGPTTPVSGNTYEILSGGVVQNPPGGSSIFPGDALTLDRGAKLSLNGTSPSTLSFPGVNGNTGLILNGGKLQAGNTNTFTLDGQISVVANSLVNLGWGSANLVITAQLSGGGNLSLFSWSAANVLDVQSANNPYSGNWLVAGGYLKGTGQNSLGAGNITVGNGTLEIGYDMQTPGTLTLLGNNSVMVLHQDCQFSAVTINGVTLDPGSYSYDDLAAQFPANFTEGGSGSITVGSPIIASPDSSATDDSQTDLSSITSNAATTAVQTADDSVGANALTVADIIAPGGPNIETVLVNSSSQITLSWSPSTDIGGSGLAGYLIYRGGVNIGRTTGTTYTDKGLSAGTQYCYTIVAYDNAGNNSPAGAPVCVVTSGDITAPPTPNIETVSVDSSSQITLSWNPSTDSGGSGVAGYLVYRGGVNIGTTTGTTYTDKGLSAGTQYCYTVVAYDNSGNSSPAGAPVCVVTSGDTTPPPTPNIETVSVDSSSQITLSWNPSTDSGGSGVAGYLVYRDGVNVGTTAGTTYTDKGLVAGTAYCYTVLAYDNAGNISALGAPVCVITAGDAAPPTTLSGVTVLVNSSSQITLSWNPGVDAGSSGIAGYQINRGGTLVATITGTTYTDSGLTPSTQYCYTIVAFDNAGNNSSVSAQTCATTLASPAPPTPPVTPPPVVSGQVFNEWYGPFTSWTNVMAWGAACDGVTDDSIAVSNALAAVGNGTCSPVLLIPGMCRVTKKPWLSQRINVAIVGLNRDTCGFIYDGGAVSDNNANNSGPASCFHIDGVANSYFARLTFNGNRKARTVLASSQQSSSGIFDNNNLFEDVVIKNAAPDGIGIDGGHFGLGFSNDEFVRCIIQTNSVGVNLENFNALDAWFTDCMFESNNIAIDVNFGDAHAYNSFFKHNAIDFSHNPGAAFCSLVSNVSYQSGIFLVTTNQGTAGTQLLLKGNTVIDPSNIPIRMGQYGPVVMLDNTILSTNASIYFYNGTWGDLIAIGNTNSISNWLAVSGGTSMRTNLVDNYVVNRSLLTYALPSPPLQATNLHRTVLEMTAGVTSASLQSSINSAADGSVFHIPSAVLDSNHNITFNSTVTVPSSKDVRIVGDGPYTRLVWSGASGGTLFSLPYPSHATFSHIDLEGNNGLAGSLMAIPGVGSSSARVYLRASNMQRGVAANLYMGDCPNAVVDFSGLSYGATATPPFTGGSNIILGGRGKARFIQSDGGNNTVGFVCNNGGQLYVETSYNEAANSTGQKLFQVGGGSIVTFLNTKLVENIGSDDFSRATGSGFGVANLTGQLSFLNCGNMIDWFNISGTSTGPIWIDGNTTFNSPVGSFPIMNATGDIPIQTMNYNYSTTGSGASRYGDSGSASAAFTRQMLAQARAEYTDRAPMARRANQTDVLLDQVFFELGNKNLSVTP